MATVLDAGQVRQALAVRDLTDPSRGRHAVQLLVDAVVAALAGAWGIPVLHHRANPVVPVADNYDRLGYPAETKARDARYSRYLTPELMLRSQTSAMLAPLLERLAGDPPADLLLACPGIVYRRDAIDRRHSGEPHQLDLWRVRSIGPPLSETDLDRMVELVLDAAVPGRGRRTLPAAHPYTVAGRQVEVDGLEVLECGLAAPQVLAAAGLPAGSSGLAMGAGLDRLVMLRKGVDDIRLLRSADPRVAGQMLDLAPYRPVSPMPAARRDLSLAVAAESDVDALGDQVRQALGADAAAVEELRVLAETPAGALPPAARARLGIQAGQKNLLLRLVLRDLDHTLTAAEANRLRDRVHAALHQGGRSEAWPGASVGTKRR